MHRSLAAPLAVRRVAWDRVIAVGTLGSLAWLLLQDRLHPLVVYLLELYLAF